MKSSLCICGLMICLLVTGCADMANQHQSLAAPTDDQGNLAIRYGDVAAPLTVVRTTGSGQFQSGMRFQPSGPPSSFDQGQMNAYWMGAASEAMRRCGYMNTVQALRSYAQDSSAFDMGSNKLQGSKMASCGEAKRFADSILSYFQT